MATRNLDNVFDRMLTLSRALDEQLGGRGNRVWFPAMDTYETGKAYVIDVDLPGVKRDAVELSFEQNTLTIRGTREPNFRREENEEIRMFAAERTTGEFARAIRLPEYVDGENISAEFEDGVLRVTVPKSQAARPRKIEIRGREEQGRIAG